VPQVPARDQDVPPYKGSRTGDHPGGKTNPPRDLTLYPTSNLLHRVKGEVPHPALESWTKILSVDTLLDIHADPNP